MPNRNICAVCNERSRGTWGSVPLCHIHGDEAEEWLEGKAGTARSIARYVREARGETGDAVLNLRNIDALAVERIRRSAAARGLTIPQYVARLSELHAVLHDVPGAQQALAKLGLETIRT